MRCDRCDAVVDPETDRHVVRSERVVAPDLGLEGGDGEVLCSDCGDIDEARLVSTE